MTEKFDLKQQMNDAEKEYGVSSNSKDDWLKLEDGDTKIRILTAMIPIGDHWTGSKYETCIGKDNNCPNCIEDGKAKAFNDALPKDAKQEDKKRVTLGVKWLVWVLDYKDNKIKLAKLPYKISSQIAAFQEDPEYAFNEAPIPWDLTINTTNAHKNTATYVVKPARVNTPVPEEVLKQLEKKNNLEDIKSRFKAKRARDLGITLPGNEQDAQAEKDFKGIDYPEEEIDPKDIPF